MTVNVVQFLRPHGRRNDQTTEVSDDCQEGYALMQKLQCRLTAECLANDLISCTIEHEHGDVDISVCENGPKVQAGLEKMLKRFTQERFDNWRMAMERGGA